ncbi:MAG: hypothetical protein ACKVHO_11160 [Verrucomicrobiia bacterium]
MFDLTKDIGEVSNIAVARPHGTRGLCDAMMGYLKEVGGRIPKPNPAYDLQKYRADPDYWDRINWGLFKWNRPLDDDERESSNPESSARPMAANRNSPG